MKLKNDIWRIWGAFLQESSEVPPKVRLFKRSSFMVDVNSIAVKKNT